MHFFVKKMAILFFNSQNYSIFALDFHHKVVRGNRKSSLRKVKNKK